MSQAIARYWPMVEDEEGPVPAPCPRCASSEIDYDVGTEVFTCQECSAWSFEHPEMRR